MLARSSIGSIPHDFRRRPLVALVDAEAGDLGEAIRFAETLPDDMLKIWEKIIATNTWQDTSGPRLKAFCLVAIASARGRAGDREAAATTFRRALSIRALSTGFDGWIDWLSDTAISQAKAGDREGARETHRRALDEADRLPIVLIPLLGSDDRYNRGRALSVVAHAQAAAGDLEAAALTRERALQAAEAIQDKEYRVQTFVGMAYVQSSGGDLAGAMRFLDARPDLSGPGAAWWRDCILDQYADGQAKRGDVASALTAVASIKDAERARRVLFRMAEVRSRADDWDGVRAIARFARNSEVAPSEEQDRRRYFVIDLARAEAELGNRDAALRIVREAIEEPPRRDPPGQWAGFLAALAPILARAGDRPGADAALREARRIAAGIAEPFEKRSAFRQVEDAEFLMADTDGVCRRIAATDFANGLDTASFGEVILLRAKAGDMRGALRIVDAFPENSNTTRDVAEVAASIATIMTARGEVAWALGWAEGQARPLAKVRALLAVACGMISSRRKPVGP